MFVKYLLFLIQTVKSFDYVLRNIKNIHNDITNYKNILYIAKKQKKLL